MTAVVATLFEAGHYEAGVAALLNSLFHAGFRGRVWCGVRGAVPEWLAPAAVEACVGAALRITVVEVTTDYHLTMYKPHFMSLVAQGEPAAASCVYFDPDVVVKCSWPFIERWAARGIAAIADPTWLMPASSPVRCDWADARQRMGLAPTEDASLAALDIYCNAGFIGVSRQCEEFWVVWRTLIDEVIARGQAQMDVWRGRPGATMWQADQDLFNVALTDWGSSAHVMGPEAMDFASGGYVFSHATGTPKPWRGHCIRSALAGRPPAKSHREYLRYREGPFHPLGRLRLRQKVGSYKIARAIGAVARRADY